MPMARNSARIGCVPIMSRARSNIESLPQLVSKDGPSAGATARRAELFDHAIHQVGVSRPRISELVVEIHSFPFEGAKLVEGLHLDPLDVLHRGHESRDTFYISGVVC